MIINKAYKLRIYPTVKQQRKLSQRFGAARFVYNHFLQYKTDYYKKTGKSASYLHMSKELTKMKDQKTWLRDAVAQELQQSLRDLDLAFNGFFNKRCGYPNFKKKFGKQSIRTYSPRFSLENNHLFIPKLEECIMTSKQQIEGILKFITISKTPTNKYYASICTEQKIPDPVIDSSKPEIGIDFGLKHFITTSAGEKIDHPEPFKRFLKKLKRASRSLSRRRKESRRRIRQKMRVSLINEKISNQRKDFLHKLSFRLVSENQAIYLEDLSLKGMSHRWGRKISDLGWRKFTRQLDYKGEWNGCCVFKIWRFFPSSKICSTCGYINTGLHLSDREWTCLGCGTVHDRDVNASRNVLQYGQADRNLRSGRVEVGNSLVELRNQE